MPQNISEILSELTDMGLGTIVLDTEDGNKTITGMIIKHTTELFDSHLESIRYEFAVRNITVQIQIIPGIEPDVKTGLVVPLIRLEFSY